MNTTQLECFTAVANFLNFSRAAEQLRISQPAVSHQINTLEDELGVKLFHRTSRSVRLTQAGYVFAQYAGEILKLTGLSRARVKENAEASAQRIGIGCRNWLELQLLRPVLARMRVEAPEIAPILRMVSTASFDNLLEEDIHLLFAFERPVSQNVAFRELAVCRICCICAPDYPFAGKEKLTVEFLRQNGKMATCPPTIYPPSLFETQSQIITGRRPDDLFFCDSLEIVYTLVEAGCAFAVMPDMPCTRAPGLCYIPIEQLDPIQFGVVYRAGELRNRALHTLVTMLEDTMK